MQRLWHTLSSSCLALGYVSTTSMSSQSSPMSTTRPSPVVTPCTLCPSVSATIFSVGFRHRCTSLRARASITSASSLRPGPPVEARGSGSQSSVSVVCVVGVGVGVGVGAAPRRSAQPSNPPHCAVVGGEHDAYERGKREGLRLSPSASRPDRIALWLRVQSAST